MTVEEVKKEQKRLEGILLNSIRDFEERTGVCVSSVSNQTVQEMGKRYARTYEVTTEIRL